MNKTARAIILNILLPGSGYLYIRELTRVPLALFLLLGTVGGIIQTVTNLMHGEHQLYLINISPYFPGFDVTVIGILILCLISADTYFLVKRQGKAKRAIQQTAS